ncbi:ABC transporter substrate-binding protein [Neobacillus sp. CF12]|uniref:ABC transporter substrate-binding protein n=1 Tax=Neobacillus sp. CF12 TaxID=3055864 RepID=UPI0025A074EB|nr:ABC transporter substrate-binding protein [Neobacillus sp. CF12]MDM5326232.1 ABC transporter substrate-binding protein [Neobacillus sp. CF12]
MKKLISSILVIVMVMVGCSNKESSSSFDPEEIELNIMMSFPQYMDQWETYIDQFEKKMLDEENLNVKVNLEMPSSDQYESVLQARLSGNDAPDLFTLHSNNISTYNKAGHLTDLTNEPFTEKLFENVKKTITHDGKIFVVPIESQAWGVLYNKKIFNELNLTAPETLNELEKITETLKENGYTPFLLAYQEQWVPQLMTALTLGGKVSGEVPDWVERMYAGEGSYEEMRDIFGPIDLIMKNGTDRAMELGSELGAADFANGKAAMFVQGTWASGTIMQTNPDMELGVFPLPINNNKANTLVNLSTSTTLAVHPDSKVKDVALKFANYVLDDKDSSTLFESTRFNPIAAIHDYETDPWVTDAYQYVEEGRSYQDLVLPQAVTEEQGKLLQEYYIGSITKDEFIKRMDEVFAESVK